MSRRRRRRDFGRQSKALLVYFYVRTSIEVGIYLHYNVHNYTQRATKIFIEKLVVLYFQEGVGCMVNVTMPRACS